jgi:hypothetical protein
LWRQVTCHSHDLGLLFRSDDLRSAILDFGILSLKFLYAQQRLVPRALQGAGYQTIARIGLLITLFIQGRFILGTLEPHLPLVHEWRTTRKDVSGRCTCRRARRSDDADQDIACSGERVRRWTCQ